MSKEKQKKKRVSRVVKGEWPDEKIRQLISFVQLRPQLWDVDSANYKTPKPQVWQEVAAELGDSFEWLDCRTKWQNLRVTYKCNLAKIDKRKSDKATDEVARVHWRFFEAMRFISRNESQQSTVLTSNLNVDDFSMPLKLESSDGSCSTPTFQLNADCSKGNSKVGKRKQRSSTIETPTPPPFIACSSVGDIGSQGVQVINRSDEHASFGNYITSELRNLTPEHAFALKRRLNRTLLDYWDEMEEQALASSPTKTWFA